MIYGVITATDAPDSQDAYIRSRNSRIVIAKEPKVTVAISYPSHYKSFSVFGVRPYQDGNLQHWISYEIVVLAYRDLSASSQ